MKIAMVGSGYVGLTSGACLAKIGHSVICVDNDAARIEVLNRGEAPFYEPGLPEVIAEAKAGNRIRFTTDIGAAVRESAAVFIAVGTPPREDGQPDLTFVEGVARDVAANMQDYRLIVEKSTVPVQTGKWVRTTIERYKKSHSPFDVASNPEFLREGSAVGDFLHPDRIVVGVESVRARELMKEIYSPIDAPIVFTDLASAELIKHASNAFLSMKISFANALSIVCEASGADSRQVCSGIGMDRRVGPAFLEPGIGYGGFCFPKDLAAFIAIARDLGYDFRLLKEVEAVNDDMKRRFVRKMQSVLWNLRDKNVGMLGLAFKPNTDDMRFAPSIDIVKALLHEGAKVKAFDPQAMERARALLPGITYCVRAEDVADEADVLAVVTEWPEFRKIDLSVLKQRMRLPIICDGRNLFERSEVEKLGFTYIGVGR